MVAESATDPAAWSWLGSLGTNSTIVLVASIPWLAILILWRGVDKLGIVGVGTTIKMNLDYVIVLLEHVAEQTPRHPDERPQHVNAAKAGKTQLPPQIPPKV